jgi:hypothetical protein
MSQIAEALQTNLLDAPFPPGPTEPVYVLSELEQDEFIRRRADRIIQGIGRVTTSNLVEVEAQVRDEAPKVLSTSLMDTIHRAAWGDPEARASLRTNILTDFIERTMKGRVIFSVKLDVDDEHGIIQYGQTQENVNTNALRYASASEQMANRAQAELRNTLRIKGALDQGLLKSYNVVVFSRTDDTMTKAELKENHFFADTMPVAIQVTTEDQDNGGIIMESAFVAGVSTPNGQPHDAETLTKLGYELNVDLHGLSATDLIDTPLLIPKSLMPNGAIDLVKLYDTCSDGTFFGEDKPQEDYLAFARDCREREKTYQEAIDEIANQLMAEAGTITNPIKAIERLNDLSEAKMVERAVHDKTIDPKVFGPAAPHIEQARLHVDRGNDDLAEIALRRAVDTAESSACPGILQKLKEGDSSSDSSDGSPESVSAEGSIRCINCRKFVDKKKVIKKDCWECPKCNYKVDICNGKVLNEGNADADGENAQVLTLQPKEKAA